ncbi:MAG TPA: ATP-binding protein [Neobacillus sp.]|jgi:PAS domain S-box-containing protein
MLKDFILNATLLISSLIILEKLSSKERFSRLKSQLFIGVFFGIIGIGLMFFSIQIDSHVFVDLRHLASVFAALFGGIPAAILSALIISISRMVFFGFHLASVTAALFMLAIGLVNGFIFSRPLSLSKKFWCMNIFSSLLVITALFINLYGSETLGKVLIYHVVLSLIIGYFIYLISQYIFKGSELMKKLMESEENFRTLAEKYEAVVSNIREVIFQLDSEGNILYVNNSWEKLTGFSIEESIGKNILSFLLEEEAKGINSQIEAKFLNGEFHVITKSSVTKIVEFSMLPLYGLDGEMNGYSGTINDISERKQQELLIKAGKQYVETLNRNLEKRIQEEVAKNRQKDHILIQQSRLAAMGEMIGSIGHQWRQPLNSLSLLIQDVREALDFGEINDQYIDRFTKESMIQINHMSRTINDFRKFYQPNKEKCSFSLSDSIEDALSIFSSSLKNHDIHVEFEYRGQQMAYGFPNEYSQVVLNILTNARDAFVMNNNMNRKMFIKIDETEAYLVAEFTDNAGGIEPALLEKVFDPYFTTRPQGTGLGLYMSKMILENMNGQVKVENTGDGARFSLTVPKVTAGVIPELISVS